MIKAIATEAERIRLIRECQQSGLTANEWCRQNGISRNTYHTWLNRLRKKGLIETAATIPTVISSEPYHQEIVKVEMVKEEPETAKTVCGPMQMPGQRKGICAERNAVMELVVGNVRIKVTNQIDTKLLADTLRMIGGPIGC